MLILLRKVRKSLLGGNKVTGYLIYAIGELILVVLGILIAVTINNWNQDQQDQEYEHTMLKEIQVSLQVNKANLENSIRRISKLDSGVLVMKKFAYEKRVFVDSLYDQPTRWYYLRTGIVYELNNGPYEALKNSGLDQIRSDTLRNALIRYYDFLFPIYRNLIEYYDGKYESEIQRLYSFLEDPFIEKRDGAYLIRQKFPKDLLTRPDFIVLLKELEYRAKSQKRLLKRNKTAIANLLVLIDSEIGLSQPNQP